MGIGRDLGKKLLSRASGKVADALSRADVVGGELRDRLTEKLASLKTPPTVVHSVTPSAPRPVAPKAPAGLGDPSRPAQVFGRSSCPWSGRAVALLESARIEHSYFELDSYGGDAVLQDLKLETKQDTVPFVFVRGRFIGGYNALDEVHRLGQLEYLSSSDAEREKHPLHGRVEVATRSHDGERFPGA
ncbi:MAG: glutaredoxin [Myxococcales bacterium]|nr:MAG: glutaredoxin [Myxococcales bacterium]